MLSVDEALALVLAQCVTLPRREIALAEADGAILAEDVASDLDSPPYDKSVVDGYAIIAEDLASGEASLVILEEVVAGDVPTVAVERGTATRIMTGAPMPPGADAVVMVERTEHRPHESQPQGATSLGRVVIRDAGVRAGRNILRRGTSLRAGDTVLRAGTQLRAAEIGLLAEVGRVRIQVASRPTVAILPTGNELIEPHETPAAGQIRNSNGLLLASAVRADGGDPVVLPIARDNESDLREKIARGLENDMLILSGGVSAGVLDLVPRVLADLGVEQVFHKLNLKPGKPLWFGVARGRHRPTLVFGLPGNPVSSFVCAELFVRPAIDHLCGRTGGGRQSKTARLETDYQQRGDRHTFLPAIYRVGNDAIARVAPVTWHGSADLRGLTAANALVSLPAGDRLVKAGESVTVRLLGDSR
ncbi:MAG TPA: gephyrin-like molybdotransferase Glp [Pirellulales bacterium]|nr:gephyrin-like molybdotransferase Glp [Pirellulales bacterium]